MSDIRIQFTLSGEDADAFTKLLVQYVSNLGRPIPCSRLAKEAIMKYVHKQLADGRDAAQGTGIEASSDIESGKAGTDAHRATHAALEAMVADWE